MATCLRTHRLTHTLLNHQRLVSDKSAIPVGISDNILVRASVCVCVRVHAHVCAGMHACVCVCMCACMFMCACFMEKEENMCELLNSDGCEWMSGCAGR